MFHARLVCSDHDCTARYEAYGAQGEIDALCCDCGGGLQTLGWPHPADGRPGADATVMLIPLDV